ncbi:hypothetical protein ES708_30859 [subsurface metagenome]
MAKELKTKGDDNTSKGLKDEVDKAFGTHGDSRVWIREDGAVCFGNECAVIKPDEDGALNLTIKPDACGSVAGGVILEHLIRTAGKGVRIVIPPSEVEKETK